MNSKFILACAAALAGGMALPVLPAQAAAADYRFELVGTPQLSGGKDVVSIRLLHVADGKNIADAVVFESTADMGPAGMPTMPAPVEALGTQNGIYRFSVAPAMAGTWALHLAAKVQGEPDTVRGTINLSLAK